MEVAISIGGVSVFAAVVAWLRCPVTLAQAYRRIAGELILRAMAREASAEVKKDKRSVAMTAAGAVRG
jgi:hypothetical protein